MAEEKKEPSDKDCIKSIEADDVKPQEIAVKAESDMNLSQRKDDNPFSFKHFLKRDSSSNGTVSYEGTGAKPKVYPNVAHRSPTKMNVYESKKEKSRFYDPSTKDWSERPPPNAHSVSNASSTAELPFGLAENSDSKHNLYTDSNEIPFYLKNNTPNDVIGMPSLPDFVQDHILVEQAYLNSNAPVTVDLENLPDFTFSANYSKSDGNRLGDKYSFNSNYNYDLDMPSTSHSSAPFSSKSVPLDLPVNRVRDNSSEYLPNRETRKVPLDLPNHLNLDLTESLSDNVCRNVSPDGTFPFDLPVTSNMGSSATPSNDNFRLPDFLPVHSGNRQSPERQLTNSRDTHALELELDSVRNELMRERQRAERLQRELNLSRNTEDTLRQEVKDWKQLEAELRNELSETKCVEQNYTESLASSVDQVENNMQNMTKRAIEAETMVSKLKHQIKQLKEELCAMQKQLEINQSKQRGVSKTLRLATNTAELSLRELLSGLEQLRGLASSLDPP